MCAIGIKGMDLFVKFNQEHFPSFNTLDFRLDLVSFVQIEGGE
jgi:hypothetical protein